MAAGTSLCAAQGVKFEVASVKAVSPETALGTSGGPGTSQPGRYYRAGTLVGLVMAAYDVRMDEVVGPGWVSDPHGPSYVVNATMPPGTTREQFRLMLQDLLKERFGLAVHHETRNFPGYDLVVSPRGAKLKPAGTLPEDVPTFIKRDSMRWDDRATSMAQLVRWLPARISESLGLDTQPRVRDMTGLAGKFDFAMEYSCAAGCGPPMMRPRGNPDAAAQGQPALATAVPRQSDLPDIFVAMEEQLGLKLVKTAAIPVDMIVIDRINRTPTEN